MGYLAGDPVVVAAAGIAITSWLVVSLTMTKVMGFDLVIAQAVGIVAGAGLSLPLWKRVLRKYPPLRRG